VKRWSKQLSKSDQAPEPGARTLPATDRAGSSANRGEFIFSCLIFTGWALYWNGVKVSEGQSAINPRNRFKDREKRDKELSSCVQLHCYGLVDTQAIKGCSGTDVSSCRVHNPLFARTVKSDKCPPTAPYWQPSCTHR
jgi:hypothetical protein